MRALRPLVLILGLLLAPGCVVAGEARGPGYQPVYGYGYGYGYGPRHHYPPPRPYYAPPRRHWGPPVYYAPPRPHWRPHHHHWRHHHRRGW
jgi:hypothetical protein